MTTLEQVRTAAERLVADCPGTAVVLFGSRARGDFDPARSDFDVAVVGPESAREAVRERADFPAPVERKFYTPERLARESVYLGSLAAAIARDGRLLAGAWTRPTPGSPPSEP